MDDNTTPDVPEDTSLANNRSKRTKKDKTGRLAALERLKKAKQTGEKYKYEVTDETDVYEEVDEETYSKLVRERQEDDWIIDDDGSGYVEDGRDIFDEDGGEMPAPRGKGKKGGAADKRRKNPNIRATDSKPSNIRSMFAAAAVKAKPKVEKEIKLNEDDLLGDIMAELHQESSASVIPAPVKLKKKTPSRPAYNPFSSKVTPKKPAPKLLTPRNMNDELTPPVKKLKRPIAPPKTSLKTALDDLDDEPKIEPEINDNVPDENIDMSAMDEEFMDEMEDKTTKEVMTNGVKDLNESVDVGDIDFDDDMETESDTKKNKKTEAIPEFKGWENVNIEESEVSMDIQVDSSQLPLTTNEDGEQVLRMFWLDAYEDRYKQPGVVYLFGKVWIESAKAHVSCCLAVRNIQRRIFLLPRTKKMNMRTKVETDEEVTFLDVYKEFSERITEKYKITSFKSKKVTKEYAFEKVDVPAESDYLEVHYPAEFPALPEELAGETFSEVFGTPTSSLELLLTDRRMRGPCWLDIKKPQMPNPAVSWCKVEAFVSTPSCVTLTANAPSSPPLVIMALNLLTIPNPKTHQNEVLGAAILVQQRFHADKPAPKPHFQHHFCAITKPTDCVFPFDFRDKVQKKGNSMKTEIMGTERALLGFLLAKIHKIDPDCIMGHDVSGFDLEVLLHRVEQNKVPHWSRVGRLKRATMPKFAGRGKGAVSSAAAGRLLADVMISAKELIRCRSYDLSELVSHVLHEKREEIDLDLMRSYYNSSSTLLQLVERTLVDATFALRILYELMVVPLALSITNICGNVMSRTLLGGRSERNEFLLLHAFHERNFIVPDKTFKKKAPQEVDGEDEDGDQTTNNKKTGRRKPAYEGGLVLEPKKGFYDKYILLLDFNSLYPSIIQEYNICFTTVTRTATPTSSEEEAAVTELPDQGLEAGVLPTEIRKLVQSRRQVKQLMKTPDISHELYMQYDIRQKALKLTANSMYGCLGFSFSRFYAKPLAALVTSKGREILMKTKDLVEAMNLEVIYGDTDSIMVNTNSTDLDVVFKLGNKVKGEVNKLYKLLEIDIDGVFKSMLLLKKKKYAALTVTKVGDKIVTAQELKGLDIVRRDWCSLAKEAGNYVVGQILSGDARESIVENIHSKLQEVGEQVKDGTLPIDLYHITKSLTKNPEDYPDKKSLPHVQVALRLNSRGGRKLRAGDTVYYVICEDGSNLAASQRAYHPDELDKADNLKIDSKYYLAHQIHPVVSRLCDPIDGTDSAFIAECLGLDPSGYRQALARADQAEDEALLGGGGISDEEKYRDANRLTVVCTQCGKQIIVDAVFKGPDLELSLGACPGQGCGALPCADVPLLMNKLTLLMRTHIKQYYEGWLRCEDTACGHRTRKVPLVFNRGHPICPVCRKSRLQQEYTDLALYTQLSFYQYIFDFEKALNSLDRERVNTSKEHGLRKEHPECIAALRQLKSHVEHQVRQCAYSQVSLSRLFEGLFSLKA